MRIGVPGEFHEDRWQHSLANHYPTDLRPVSFRCHNRSSARRPCPQVLQSHLRVAKQSSIGPSARRPCPEVSQRHPRVANHPPTDLKTFFFRCHNRSSARRPCPQVLQSHLRVAKQSSIGPSARGPCLQAPQSHLHVAKRSSDRSLERPPRPQMPQWPPR